MALLIVPKRTAMERQLQILAVAFHAFVFFFGAITGFILSLISILYIRQLYFLPLIYLLWFVYDKNTCNQGGRLIPSVQKWTIWKYYRDYFPLTLIKTADLDPKKNYIIGYHPHGIFCFGAFGHFCTEATGFKESFPGITPRFVTLEGMFSSPLHREFLLSAGLCAASARSINWLLRREGTGNAVVIAVGGQAEALDAHPKSDIVRLTLAKRKGFIRLALKNGASLVPSFTFGENDVYYQVPNPDGSPLRKFQQKMTKYLGFSTPLFHGRGIFLFKKGYLPYRRPLTTIIGKPINVEAVSEPTTEDVDMLHDKYMQGLQELFDEYKGTYGDANMKLKL